MKFKIKNINNFFYSLNANKISIPFIFNVSIVILISFFIFFILSNTFENQDENKNIYLAQNIEHSFSLFFSETNRISDEIDDSIVDSNSNISSQQQIIKLVGLLKKNITDSSFIENIVVMKNNSDTLYTALGTIDKITFFDKYYSNSKYDSKFWNILATNDLNIKIIPSTLYEDKINIPTNKPKQLLALYRSNWNTNNTIIIYVDQEKIIDYLNIKSKENKTDIVLFDQYYTPLLTNNTNITKLNVQLLPNQFFKSFNNNFKKYYLIKSIDYNFIYLITFNNNNYLILFFCLFLIIGSAIISIILARKFSISLFAPMKTIVDELDLCDDKHNFNDVMMKISTLKNDYKKNSEKLNFYNENIVKSTFTLLISESGYYRKNKNIVNSTFEKISSFDYFMLLSVEGNISQTFIDKLNLTLPCISIEKNLNRYVIIGINSVNEYYNVKTKLIELAENKRDIWIFSSKPFDDLSEIYNANNDIIFYHSHIMTGIKNTHNLITEDDISVDAKMFLPANLREELTAYLLSNEEEAAKNYLKSIIDKNSNENVQFFRLEHVFRVLYNYIVEIISINCDKSELLEYEKIFLAKIKKFNQNSDTQKIKAFFDNFIHLYITHSKQKNVVGDYNKIIKYINNNYNKDISLDIIADIFKTTPKYFSNYFKKAFGIGFIDYLTQIRISHAKELMENSDLSLNEISESVGYLNHSTFSVAFKKIINMTPSKYRETVKN